MFSVTRSAEASARVCFALAFVFAVFGGAAAATGQPSGSFIATGDMVSARSQHSATLLPDGRVLIAGGASSNVAIASTEIYDPAAGTFRIATPMSTARRGHTATLLPDDTVLLVGGWGNGGALASAELYDPVSGTLSPAGNLNTPRGGHSAILLATGTVLIVGGYGTNAYPDVAPAELYDPSSRTFVPAGDYVGRGGCDFCAPSVPLPDGTALFPGQYPAQIYDPGTNSFSPVGMMLRDQSTAAVLMNGQVLFAGGVTIGRVAEAELYNPVSHAFVPTGGMAAPRVWHTLTPLPNGMVLAAGGETDACGQGGCWFAGSLATAELYDPSAGAFIQTGSMTAARGSHTATLLRDGRVLIAGGVWYGGIGIFGGSLASAELYSPDQLVPAPDLVSMPGEGQRQGVIFHGGTRHLVTVDDPAGTGETVDIYCTGLRAGTVILPRIAIGGRLAALLAVSAVPGADGVTQLRVRIPSGLSAGPAVPVRLTYLDRPSNEVTVAVH